MDRRMKHYDAQRALWSHGEAHGPPRHRPAFQVDRPSWCVPSIRLCILVALLTLSTTAAAQGPATPSAEGPASAAALELYEQGRSALTAGDLETACGRFRASDKLDAAAGTRANLGTCEERRGRVATAWEAFKSALAILRAGDTRAPIIKARIDALRPRLPRLVLSLEAGAPADTTVSVGSAVVGAGGTWGIPLPFDPGPHKLVVTAAGKPSRVVDVVLVEAETKEVIVGWGAAPGPVQGPVGDLGSGAPSVPVKSGPGAGPWVVGGIGAAGLVVGIATGAVVLQKHAEAEAGCSSVTRTCTPAAKAASDSGRALGPVVTTGLVVGGVGLAAAGIWLGVGGSGKARVGVGVAGTRMTVEGSW
jgi:hypothetical protein